MGTNNPHPFFNPSLRRPGSIQFLPLQGKKYWTQKSRSDGFNPLKCCFTRQMNEKIPHSLLFARSLIPLFYLKQASMKWKPRSFSKTFSYVLFGIYEYFA